MADMQLTGGNAATDKFLNYYNQYKTHLQTNPNTITPDVINVQQQSLDEIRKQVSDYLRPYTDQAIKSRQAQTGANRAEADVDAASRGMVGSTWLSDAKNRMLAAEASDVSALESQFSGDLGTQVYNAYQQQMANKLSADQQNVANKLAADQFNAQLYQTLEQLAYKYAGDMYALAPVSRGGGSRDLTNIDIIPTNDGDDDTITNSFIPNPINGPWEPYKNSSKARINVKNGIIKTAK